MEGKRSGDRAEGGEKYKPCWMKHWEMALRWVQAENKWKCVGKEKDLKQGNNTARVVLHFICD